MNRLVLALLVLAALAASLWFWLGREPTPVAPAAGPGRDVEAAAEAPSLAPEEPVASERAVVPEADLPGAATSAAAALEVHVRASEDDRPIEGVEVVALAWSEGTSLELTGRTDAEGLCRLEHATAFLAQKLEAHPTATTAAGSRYLESTWVDCGTTVPLTLLVSAGATLVGHVVDGDGRPVEGARVLGWCTYRYEPTTPPDRETTSDASGRFELGQLGEDFRLVAEKEGLGCSQGLKGKLAPGAQAEGDLRIVLEPMRVVRGRVIGERNEALQAHLKIDAVGFGSSEDATGVIGVERWRPVRVETECDAQGAFALGPVPRGRWNVEFAEPRHLQVRMRVPEDEGEWIVRLPAGSGVQGFVLASDGQPLAGAGVALHGGPGDEGRRVHRAGEPQVLYGTWRETRSAEDGSFSVGGVEPGPDAILKVSAPDHAPWLKEGLDLQPGANARLDVYLEPGQPLAGRVVETDGTPVAGAKLQLEGDRTYARDYSSSVPATWEHLFGRGDAMCDAQGRFRFEDLYAGRFEVHVSVPGGVELHQDAVAFAGDEGLEIVIDRAALERVVLEGRVTDRRTGEPLRSFTVTPMMHEGNQATGRATAVNDDEGRFRVAGLDPGLIGVTVRAPGYAMWTTEPQELAVGVHRFEVGLVALRSVGLRLLLPDGQPYLGRATARFSRTTGEEVWVQSNISSTNLIRFGRGVAEGLQLPAELLQVAFDLHDGEPERIFDLDLERDPSEVFEFRVEPAGGKAFLVQSVVFSATADFDAAGIEQALQAGKLPADDPRFGPVAVGVVLAGRNARGVALVTGSLEPTDGGFLERWVWPGEGRSSEGKMPLPGFSTALPASVRTLGLEADGHEPLELALDPEKENGGLPRILVLRRR